MLPSALSEDFEVIAPVHPGFAGTRRPEWYVGIDDIALSYLQLLERRDLRDVLVVGSSIGGWIAPEAYGRAYAASFPNGRFEPIREAGHLPHLEQPERVLEAIHRFADETIRPAAK